MELVEVVALVEVDLFILQNLLQCQDHFSNKNSKLLQMISKLSIKKCLVLDFSSSSRSSNFIVYGLACHVHWTNLSGVWIEKHLSQMNTIVAFNMSSFQFRHLSFIFIKKKKQNSSTSQFSKLSNLVIYKRETNQFQITPMSSIKRIQYYSLKCFPVDSDLMFVFIIIKVKKNKKTKKKSN